MAEQDEKPAWHAEAVEEVLRRLETSADGLHTSQARERLDRIGPNALEAGEGIHPLRLLVRQVHSPLIYLLIGAAVLSLLGGHGIDAAVIAGVVILNTVLGFVQEWRAEGALAALRKMSAPRARVLRDGQMRQLDASEVVPGDILALETGDRVAADTRVLSSDDLHVDESALTGESQPVAKGAGEVEESTPMADRRNMVWMSTGVTGGRGRAVVVETGMRTEMGKIAEEVRGTRREETPLQKRMSKLGTVLGIGGVVLALLVFMLGLLRGYGFVEMLLFAVAVAVSAIPEGLPAVIQQGLTLAGLWGMIDPPRDESIQAVADAKAAGIRPIMITGDHATTALAIARQVGITESDRALTGRDVQELDRSRLADEALKVGVFARVSPADKLKILESLKEKGHIVAMTGDGVNDAPALKGADIGVAMGRAGMEVAKEAADMVLTDDNFATIVHAVEEGRVIYSNLRRVVFFLLATNLGEVLTLVGALLIGLDLPLTAIMVLWINLVTDGACTVPLGVEPRHWDVLKQPPRDPSGSILDRTMLRRMAILTPIMAVGTLLLFWYEIRTGTFRHAQTVAFTTMAAFQWFQAFNARAQYQSVFSIGLLTNRWLLLGIGAAALLQIAAVHTSLGQRIFGTAALSWYDWVLILLVSSSIWLADELLKRLGVHGRLPTPPEHS